MGDSLIMVMNYHVLLNYELYILIGKPHAFDE